MSKVIRLIHLCHLNQDAAGKKCVQSEDTPAPLCCLPNGIQEVQMNGSQSNEWKIEGV
jgi:hypothetical protein